MATRKKKTTVIESADVAEMTNVDNGSWPKIQQGTHLTVKTFEDGHTELVWDDDALLAEVQAAIASVTTKPTRKKKEK